MQPDTTNGTTDGITNGRKRTAKNGGAVPGGITEIPPRNLASHLPRPLDLVTLKIEAPAPFVSTPIKRKISLRTPAGKRNNVTVTFQHKEDPRAALLDRIGPMPEGVVQFSRILVAVYQPPMVEKTDGGIMLTPVMQQEDLDEFLWQGKVGLIVAMGSQAYIDDEATRFHGVANKVGDWVWFRPSNGEACEVNGVFCRVFGESGIYGPIPHPDYVW